MFKRIIWIIIAIAFIMTNMSQAYAANTIDKDGNNSFASLQSENIMVSNQYAEISVNYSSGRFTIGTVDGNPNITTDQNKKLLFGHPSASTSFSSFKIDGEPVIFGNIYSVSDGDANNSSMLVSPYNVETSNISIWRYGNLEIKQTLSIRQGLIDQYAGNVEIKYEVTNKDNISHQLGTRIMLDTMLGENDGSPIRVPETGVLVYESEFVGSDVPMFWQSFDSVDNPNVVAQGTLYGWDDIKPDKFVAAYWWNLRETVFDYTTSSRTIASDSAVAVYFNPSSIAPGQTKTFTTYYGIGDITGANSENGYAVALTGPTNVNIAGNDYYPNPVKLGGYIENYSNDTMQNVSAVIELPSGLTFANNDIDTKLLNEILTSQKKDFWWNVNVEKQSTTQSFTYKVNIYVGGELAKTVERVLNVPAFTDNIGGLVSFTNAQPKLLDINSEKVIFVTGAGFNKITDVSQLTVELQRSGSTVVASSIEKISDQKLKIVFSGNSFVLDQSYSLVISHSTFDDRTFYDWVKFTDNANIAPRPGNLTSLMVGNTEIQGTISDLGSGKYEASGDVTINKVIKYSSNSPLNIDINTKEILGEGELFIPVVTELNAKIPLLQGVIKINGNDGVVAFKNISGKTANVLLKYDVGNGNLPAWIESIKILSNGVDIKGYFDVTQIFKMGRPFSTDTIKAEFNSLQITSNGWQVDATLEVKRNVDLGILLFKEIALKINTQEKGFGGKIKLDIGKMFAFGVEADIMIKNGKLDKLIGGYAPIYPWPIASSGFGFTKYRVGVDNMADPNIYSRDIMLGTDISFIASPKIRDSYLINFSDLNLAISLSRFRSSGKMTLYGIEMSTSSIDAYYSPFKIIAVFRGDVFDIYLLDGSASYANGIFIGSVKGTVQIPNYSVIPSSFRGKRLDETSGSINASTGEIRAYKALADLGWFGELSLELIINLINETVHLNGMKIYPLFNFSSYGLNDATDEFERRFAAGNIVFMGSNQFNESSSVNQRMVSLSEETSYSFNVTDEEALLLDIYNYVLIDENADKNIVITAPDNTTIPLMPYVDANTLYNCFINDEEATINVLIKDPMPGQWKISSNNISEWNISCYAAILDTNISNASVVQNGAGYDVAWSSTQNDVTVDIYLSPDGSKEAGILLAEGVSGKACNVQIPDYVPTGEYNIILYATRGSAAPKEVTINTSINFVNTNTPQTPLNFSVQTTMNGYVNIQWDKVDNADFYIVAGKPFDADDTVSYYVTDSNDVTSASIALEYEKNIELFVVAVKSIPNSTDAEQPYYLLSNESNKVSVNLASPVYPTIDLQFSSPTNELKEKIYDVENNFTYIYSRNSTIYILANVSQVSEVKLIVDDEEYKSFSNCTVINETLTLEDGNHVIQLVATNADGNETVVSKEICIDTIPPVLYIDTPYNGDSTDGTYITIIGRTEYGTTLSINNILISEDIEVNGDFIYDMPISGDVLSTLLTIKSEDSAGNISLYEATIFRNFGAISELRISSSSYTLGIGENRNIVAKITNTMGQVIDIPEEYLKLMISDNFVQANGLTVSGMSDGKAIVTAELKLSDNYSITSNEVEFTVGSGNSELMLTISASNGGTITTGQSGNYSRNAIINLVATPNSGYRLASWTTSNGGLFENASSATTTFTMPENDTIVTANFVEVSIELNKCSYIMHKGDSFTLLANVIPYNAEEPALVWTSSDESVVLVDQQGKLTAIKVGTAIITVTTQSGDYSVTSEITVKPVMIKRLAPGWNILSIPLELHKSKLEDIIDITKIELAFGYKNNSGWYELGAANKLGTMDAIFVKVTQETDAKIRPSLEMTGPYTKRLQQGWNLFGPALDISSSEGYSMQASKILGSIIGKFSNVISQNNTETQSGWSYVANSEPIPIMTVGEGYWVYMNEEGVLAGFSFTPVNSIYNNEDNLSMGLLNYDDDDDTDIPALPAAFCGVVRNSNGHDVVTGKIEVVINGIVCSEKLFNDGKFGMEIGDRLLVYRKHYINANTISFLVNGKTAVLMEDFDWTTASGKLSQIILVVDEIDECFIATAAFGSKFTWPVALLRHFRDQYLLTNTIGTAFVDFYYRHSPPIAAYITTSELLKGLVRMLLLPLIALVYLILHPILGIAVVGFGVLVLLLIRNRRKAVSFE